MKTTSRRRSKSDSHIIIVLVVGVLLVALLLSPLRIAGSVLEVVSWPFRALSALVPDSLASYLKDKDTLIAERDRLQSEVVERTRELDTLKSSIADYDALRALRTRSTEGDIMSAVLLTPPLSPYDSLVLDMGTNDGVQEGAVVRAYEGRPIGTIVRAEPTTSVVALFSSPGVETVVYVRGAEVHARAVGIGAGTIAVLVPHGSEVERGDAVLLPSIDAARIGIVEWISDDQSAPGTVVHVPQTDALTSLRFVSVDREIQPLPTEETIRENLTHASTTVATLFLPLSELASTTVPTLVASGTATTTD